MTDEKHTPPTETSHFETDTVQADRAREQGLGLGARELEAQRDPGGVRTANEDSDVDKGGEDVQPGDTVDDANQRNADSQH